jgi:hypothetical protein
MNLNFYSSTDVRLIVFSTIFTRFVIVSTASTPFLPLRMSLSLASRPALTTYRSGISGPIVVARPKRCPQWVKRLHIRLAGSRAVTNRHTSEAQSPAPGTSRFEIGGLFWRDGRDLWVGFWVFLFCVRLFVLCLCCA